MRRYTKKKKTTVQPECEKNSIQKGIAESIKIKTNNTKDDLSFAFEQIHKRLPILAGFHNHSTRIKVNGAHVPCELDLASTTIIPKNTQLKA